RVAYRARRAFSEPQPVGGRDLLDRCGPGVCAAASAAEDAGDGMSEHTSALAVAAGRRLAAPRPTLDSEVLLLLVVVFLLAAVNGPFWSSLFCTRSFAEAGTWRFAVSSFVALTALHFFCIGLFATRRLIRPLL